MLIHVKIKPDSKEDKIVEKNETSFIVYVKEPAEKFNIVKSKVKIVTGHHAPSKILDILD